MSGIAVERGKKKFLFLTLHYGVGGKFSGAFGCESLAIYVFFAWVGAPGCHGSMVW